MGKVWVYSIALAWVSVGLTVGCAGNATPLAAEENPLDKYLARLPNSSGKTSSAFGNQSKKTPRISQRVVSAVKENPISDAISSFAQQSTKLLTPKPRVERAVDPLSLHAESPPPTPELYIAMAWAGERQENPTKAEEFYQKALDIDPENTKAISGYAHLLDRQERFDEAIRLYLQITSRLPEQAPAHNDLGLCYARQGMLAEAIESLERAVTLQPKRKLYRNNIATILTEVDRTEEALSHLTAVYGEAIAHYNVGYLLHMRGDDRRAVDHFAAALQSNPAFAEAQDWFNRLGNQFVDEVAIQPAVEVTDLPEVDDTAQYGVAPEPAQIPSYLQQHQLQTSVDLRQGQAFDKDHAEAPSAGSLQVPSQVPDDGLSGRGALPPSPDQVYQYWMTAAPQPLPPVPEN